MMGDVELETKPGGSGTLQQQQQQQQQPPRPMSTASSQLSFSDRLDIDLMGGDDGGGDADEDNSSLHMHHNYPPSSTCSSSFNLHRQSSSEGHDSKLLNGTSAHPAGSQIQTNPHPSGAMSSTLTARTTTISTIAMESNTSATSKCSPTRLVIALLQTPHHGLHLKVLELTPSLLKLPDNLVDADDFLKNHTQVIKNLQSKQSPVEELLRQADSLIATQKPRAEVYAAMAESLGQTWKDLNALLDERRVILELAYNCHKVIQCCVERMNEVHSEYSKFSYIPTIEEQYFQSGKPQDVAASLRKLKEDRAQVLKLVSQALDVCGQLLHKISDFNFSIDSRQLHLKRDVDFATKQVHRWLERLHDRRILLEERLKVKREQFEEMAEFLLHDKEMATLLQELERLQKLSQEFSLGSSVATAESQRDELEKMVKEMKTLQERALLTARKLEVDERDSKSKGRFYQRSGLKQKIYDILGTVNDLITESIDFELSLVDAKEFFHLAELAKEKLDEYVAAVSPEEAQPQQQTKDKLAQAKSEIDSLTYDALSKGQVLLDSLGWDAPRTRGVRPVYDELSKKKAVIQEQIDHLELLDEYNHFLEALNKAYQNILNVETCSLRQPKCVPVEIHLVDQFRTQQEQLMEDLSAKTNFKSLLANLEKIYPNLSEEEKMSTEEKVNQLKSLSNLLMELLLQRIWLSGDWLKVLEYDRNEWDKISANPSSSSTSNKFEDVLEKIMSLYSPIQQQLDQVHRTDPDLITNKMEEKIEEIIRKYRERKQKLTAVHKIRDICHAYKVKLDHHLLGKTDSVLNRSSEPLYFPVLNEALVLTALSSEGRPSSGLERIRKEQLEQKLNSTLANFFQPLLTEFRQEILSAQQESGAPALGDKTEDEIGWERYFERLKECYVRVTKSLEDYVLHLQSICKEVEETIERSGSGVGTVGDIEKALGDITRFKSDLGRRMENEVKKKMENVLSVINSEEPPIQAREEERTLRNLTTNVVKECVESPLSQIQDALTRQLTEKMIHNDLDMINQTLNELISELEHPCNYGNNLKDAEAYFQSFERFEKTVETLRDKLSRLLTTAGMSETDVKAQNLLGKLSLLVDRKGKRRDLILQSLEYFRLIELSYEHYDNVNKVIDEIISKSKNPDIKIEDIEELLKQLGQLKTKETEQEKRLEEIERISKIIFDVSQEDESRHHHSLRDRGQKVVGDITRVESDLTSLIGLIRSQSESSAAAAAPSPKQVTSTSSVLTELEMELESQIITEIPKKAPDSEIIKAEEKRQLAQEKPSGEPKEVIEELIVPTRVVRPKSQEIYTQTTLPCETDEELEAKTQEYLKEKEKITMAVLEVLRQSMSPLPPPPQTVEKETQFEELGDETRKEEKVDRDTLTQTIKERLRSFETQTEEMQTRGVEMGTETDQVEMDMSLVLEQTLLHREKERPQSREYLEPMFVQPLKDLVVNEGDKVVLECKTTGRIQKLVWLKDGLEIINNPDYKTDFLDGSTANLTIDEALQEDSAIFTCRAYGEGDLMVETSGRLTIREPVTSLLVPPTFVPHPPISLGEHGKSHVIQLKVEGNPLPTVQWFKDGQCIDTSPDYIITFNNGLCEVQFDELVKDMDDGIYTCVAINKLGDAETKVELQIKGDIDITKKLSRQPPRIISPLPKNLMSRAGQRVKLECEFESHTDFTVVWIKDDNKILTKTNSSAEITTEGSTSKLVFNEAYPVNSGKYTILIRNAGGECQSDCQIVVKGLLPAETSDSELNISDGEAVKPTVKMPLKDANARVGESLRLDCVIVGNPEPEVIWYKNSVPLKESPNHHLLFQGDKCSLVIDHADLGDKGTYSVSALNNCGEASSKCQVFVFEKTPEMDEPKPIEAPKFTKIIQDEMVTAGHEFSFVVEVAPNEDVQVKTDVTWFKNNSPVVSTPRIEIKKEDLIHSLNFKEVDLGDKGNYMVKASNPGGDTKCFGCLIVKENFERAVPEKPVEAAPQVAVQAAPLQKQSTPPPIKKSVQPRVIVKPPRFVIPLEGKMVDEGDSNVTLKCKVDASPPAIVKWTKNNGAEPLDASTPASNLFFKYNERSGEAELTFSSVCVKDGGRYTCHASNEHGLASSVADLIVKKTTFPPVFSKRLQSLTTEEEKRIYLEVDVFGKPAPQVQWFLNDNLIQQDEEEGITIRSDTPTRHCLIISSGKKEKNAGDYKVIAKNDAGEAFSVCTVNIVPKSDLGSGTSVPIEIVFAPKVQPQLTSSMKSTSFQENSSLKREESNLVETTTIITSTEEHLYETRVTEVISPVPSAELDSLTVKRTPPIQAIPVQKPKSPAPNITLPLLTDESELEPGPPPEVLIAPAPPSSSSIAWYKSQNQVLEKVKRFEEETSESEAPSGGVRIIPISKAVAPTTAAHAQPPATQVIPLSLGEPLGPIQPLAPPAIGSTSISHGSIPVEGYKLVEPPKVTQDSASTISKDSYKVGDAFVSTEERHETHLSSSAVKYLRPSKFVPEKMRESDHESEVESTVIPSKWVPPTVSNVSASTTSAFVPISPTSIPQTTNIQQPKPTPQSSRPIAADTVGVRSIAKQWPPQNSTMESSHQTQSTFSSQSSSFSATQEYHKTLKSSEPLSLPPGSTSSRLSPIGYNPERSCRSPTPNKEALEMDKLWSRPIKFSSPVTVPTSSIPIQSPIPPAEQRHQLQSALPSQPIISPPSTLKRGPKPEPPPKPQSSWLKRTTPTQPYSPISSPLPPVSPIHKPEVPPKPSYLKSSPTPYSPMTSPLPSSRPGTAGSTEAPSKEPFYYVSTVSTPRTTPVPPQLGWASPLPTTPEVPMDQSYSSHFNEKREFFESSTTSYSAFEEITESSQKQFSSSSTSKSFNTQQGLSITDVHPSGISLLDQSLLPPPGEPPVFMYAPPPPPTKPSKPASTHGESSQFKRPLAGSTGSTMSSSSSLSKNLTEKKVVTSLMVKAEEKVIPPRLNLINVSAPQQQQQQMKPTKALDLASDSSGITSLIESSTKTLTKLSTSSEMKASSSTSQALVPFRRRQDAPYIRPTKFVPVLDYFSSSDREDQEGSIKPKWKPGEENQQQLLQWRKVNYVVPPEGKKRRDSLSSLVDINMQEMNQRFKQNISQLSQGLCYNRMDRKVEKDLGSEASGKEAVKSSGGGGGEIEVDSANPLIYFKYDFGYEFGIASPRSSTRAASEPPAKNLAISSTVSSRPTSSMFKENDGDDATISLPIIHETTSKK